MRAASWHTIVALVVLALVSTMLVVLPHSAAADDAADHGAALVPSATSDAWVVDEEHEILGTDGLDEADPATGDQAVSDAEGTVEDGALPEASVAAPGEAADDEPAPRDESDDEVHDDPADEQVAPREGSARLRLPGPQWDLMDPGVYPVAIDPASGPVEGGTLVQVPNPEPIFVDIASGLGGGSALARDGRVFTWGRGAEGQLGNGTSTATQIIPVMVHAEERPTGGNPSTVYKKIERSSSTALATAHYAIHETGSLWAWGSGAGGRLGLASLPVPINQTTPTHVGGLSGPVRDVAASAGGAVALTEAGSLFAWGRGNEGQMGNGATTATTLAPSAVPLPADAAGKTLVRVEAGYNTYFALADDGTLYGWGQNASGQLGTGDRVNQSRMVRAGTAGAMGGRPVVDFATYGDSVVALGADGLLYTWGRGNWGGMGNGTSVSINVETQRVDMTGVMAGKQIERVFGAGQAGFAVDTDGVAYAWGGGGWRELGNGNVAAVVTRPERVDMSGALAGRRIVQIDGSAVNASTGGVVALTSDGMVFAWGGGVYGQLGHGSTTFSNVPVEVALPSYLRNGGWLQSTVVYFTRGGSGGEWARAEYVSGSRTPTLTVRAPASRTPGLASIFGEVGMAASLDRSPIWVGTHHLSSYTYEGEVVPEVPIEIITHPESTRGQVGDRVRLRSVATGGDALTATWQARADEASGWQDVTDGVSTDADQGDGRTEISTSLETSVRDQAVDYRVLFRSPAGEEVATRTAVVSPPTGPLGPQSTLVVTPRASMVTGLPVRTGEVEQSGLLSRGTGS